MTTPPKDAPVTEAEHEGWVDMSDRDLLDYAWSVLSKTERTMDRRTVEWAEVATAVGHLRRRLDNEAATAARSDGIDAAWAEAEAATPHNWYFVVYSRRQDGYMARATRAYAATESELRYTPDVIGLGDTPAAALRALAVRLRSAT